ALGFRIGRVEPFELALDRRPNLGMIIALQFAKDFDRWNRDGYIRAFDGDHMAFRLNHDPERLQRRPDQVDEMIPARFLRARVRRARMLIEIPESLEDIGIG